MRSRDVIALGKKQRADELEIIAATTSVRIVENDGLDSSVSSPAPRSLSGEKQYPTGVCNDQIIIK